MHLFLYLKLINISNNRQIVIMCRKEIKKSNVFNVRRKSDFNNKIKNKTNKNLFRYETLHYRDTDSVS